MMLVTIDEPETVVYGGLVAAPIFSRIAAQALQYLKMALMEMVTPQKKGPTLEQFFAELPERQPAFTANKVAANSGDGPQMPDFIGMSYRQVLKLMGERRLNLSFRGQGHVVEQYPSQGNGISYGTPAWVRLAPPG